LTLLREEGALDGSPGRAVTPTMRDIIGRSAEAAKRRKAA
jgi:hypothetical protein